MMNFTRAADELLAAAIARRDAFTKQAQAEDQARGHTPFWRRWFGHKAAAQHAAAAHTA